MKASPKKFFSWTSKKKRIYSFNEGSPSDIHLLGVKGATLCDLLRKDHQIPPGFIISADTAHEYTKILTPKEQEKLIEEYKKGIREIEKATGKRFGMPSPAPAPVASDVSAAPCPSESVSEEASASVPPASSNLSPSKSSKSSKSVKLEDESCSSTMSNLHLTMPLLLSIRSSSLIPLPGVMDSVLNIGLNDAIIENLVKISGEDTRWVYDTYRKFLENYGCVVHGVERSRYDEIMKKARRESGVMKNYLLDSNSLIKVIKEYKEIIAVPQDPYEQLLNSIAAIYKSWNNYKCDKYKELFLSSNSSTSLNHDTTPSFFFSSNVPSSSTSTTPGLAIICQAMVYGNLNERCGSGIAYSRDPNTGEKTFSTEFISYSFGEDSISYTRDVKNLNQLKEEQASLYHNLLHILKNLERYYKDIIEIQYTVEDNKLYLLNVKPACKSYQASITTAVQLVKDKLITEREAIMMIDPTQLVSLHNTSIKSSIIANEKRKQLQMKEEEGTAEMKENVSKVEGEDEDYSNRLIGLGLGTSCGSVCGRLCFSIADVISLHLNRTKKKLDTSLPQNKIILCATSPSHELLDYLDIIDGLISIRGGMSSKVSSCMRSLGKPCVSTVRNMIVDNAGKHTEEGEESQLLSILTGGKVQKNELITIDGEQGMIFYDEMPMEVQELNDDTRQIINWSKEYKHNLIFSSYSSPYSSSSGSTLSSSSSLLKSYKLCADGIGIIKTNSLFLHPNYQDLICILLLSDNESLVAASLAKLVEFHTMEYRKLFQQADIYGNLSLNLLDYPLSSCLPSQLRDGDNYNDRLERLNDVLGYKSIKELEKKIRESIYYEDLSQSNLVRMNKDIDEIDEEDVKSCKKDIEKKNKEDKDLLKELKETKTSISSIASKLLNFSTSPATSPSTSSNISSMYTSSALELIGLRGCRLALLQPSLLMMQARAIMRAIIESFSSNASSGTSPAKLVNFHFLQLILPSFFCDTEPFKLLPLLIDSMREEFLRISMKNEGNLLGTSQDIRKIKISWGLKLSTPRSCLEISSLLQKIHHYNTSLATLTSSASPSSSLSSSSLASSSVLASSSFFNDNFNSGMNLIDFFLIDTDELTQWVYGIEKESAEKFLSMYLEKNLLTRDPFTCLDIGGDGVSKMIENVIKEINQYNQHHSKKFYSTNSSQLTSSPSLSSGSNSVPSQAIRIVLTGDHGSDPLTIRYYSTLKDISFISVPLQAVPCAIVSAAQARIKPNEMKMLRYSRPFGKNQRKFVAV